MIYLDNAATTFPKSEEVYRAMDDANRHLAVNAGRGSYALARKAAEMIQNTREALLAVAGAEKIAAEVVFTASATIAFNAIIGGLHWTGEETVYVSPYEHNAVMRTLRGYQKKFFFSIRELPLKEDTLEIDVDKTKFMFAQTPPQYVIVNMVSNVTGYALPVETVAACAKQYDATVILDGAQALGSIPVNLKSLNADFLVFAGHKAIGGPFGIGGYIHQGNSRLQPFLYGGTGSNSLMLDMPEGVDGYEPGSPNIVAIAGLYTALMGIREEKVRRTNWEKEQHMVRTLRQKLQQIPGLRLYGAPKEDRQAGILSVNLEGYRADEVGNLLDADYGIAVRTGYHCAPLIHKHLRDETYGGTVRISPGRFTTEDDLQKAADALRELAEY